MPRYPCNGWVSEANARGVTLRCKPGGDNAVDGRPTQKWDASTPDRGQGSLWYDPTLNFIVKVLRISKTRVRSGYELQNAKIGPQPPDTFEVPKGYRKFTLQRLVHVFTGLGQSVDCPSDQRQQSMRTDGRMTGIATAAFLN
jgi:hypothetical protein